MPRHWPDHNQWHNPVFVPTEMDFVIDENAENVDLVHDAMGSVIFAGDM